MYMYVGLKLTLCTNPIEERYFIPFATPYDIFDSLS